MREACPSRDFVLDHNGKPLGYSGMLSRFRRCLVTYAGLEPSVSSSFTLHSLKTTLLTWASQVGVTDVLREAQGHHRSASVSSCVRRYSRDDINPQLKCQCRVLEQLKKGWRPYVPVDRGLGRVDEALFAEVPPLSAGDAPAAALSDTEDESDEGEIREEPEVGEVDNFSETGTVFDSESEAGEVEEVVPLDDLADCDGHWLLNVISGCAHKSVWCKARKVWALACRPSLSLGDQYEHWTRNPGFRGLARCWGFGPSASSVVARLVSSF